MATRPTRDRVLMNAQSIDLAVRRMAREVAAQNTSAPEVVLVGIQTGGVCLARQLAVHLEQIWGAPVPVGQLDVSMHRDDLDGRLAPKVHPTSIPFDVTDKTVVLVDDVLFHGRTTRAAMDALNDLGRPRRIQLAVLIDRGHRELPIEADFVGKQIATALTDRIDVQLAERVTASQVVLEKAAPQ
jgi:pyrimidine operon attenuation protein / uracil phosphoribosyltransferase